MSTPNCYITWDNKLVVNCVVDGRIVAIVNCGRNYMVRVGPRGSFIIELQTTVSRNEDDDEELTQQKRKRKSSGSEQGQGQGPAEKKRFWHEKDDRSDREGGQGGQGVCA